MSRLSCQLVSTSRQSTMAMLSITIHPSHPLLAGLVYITHVSTLDAGDYSGVIFIDILVGQAQFLFSFFLRIQHSRDVDWQSIDRHRHNLFTPPRRRDYNLLGHDRYRFCQSNSSCSSNAINSIGFFDKNSFFSFQTLSNLWYDRLQVWIESNLTRLNNRMVTIKITSWRIAGFSMDVMWREWSHRPACPLSITISTVWQGPLVFD